MSNLNMGTMPSATLKNHQTIGKTQYEVTAKSFFGKIIINLSETDYVDDSDILQIWRKKDEMC